MRVRGTGPLLVLLALVATAAACGGGSDDSADNTASTAVPSGAHSPATPDEQAAAGTVTRAYTLLNQANPDVCDYYSSSWKRTYVADAKDDLGTEFVEDLESSTGRSFDCRTATEFLEPDTPRGPGELFIVGEVNEDAAEVLAVPGPDHPLPEWVRWRLQREGTSDTGWVVQAVEPDFDSDPTTPG